MNVTIIETNEKETLSIIDPKSGCDYTTDLIGNHGELPDYNEDTDSYHMTKESFNWWANLIDRYEKADDRQYEISASLDHDEQNDFQSGLQSACDCDLENIPEAINCFCDEWEEEHK